MCEILKQNLLKIAISQEKAYNIIYDLAASLSVGQKIEKLFSKI